MARTYTIDSILQSGGVGAPGRIILSVSDGDVTNSFHGKFWREIDPPHGTLDGFLPAPQPGYKLILATSFDIVNNPSYAGRYTVYSPIDAPDIITNPSSDFSSSKTRIHVNEVVGPPLNVGDDSIGEVTNISTYVIQVVGDGSPTVIPPGVTLDDRPIQLVGRTGTPWGEAYTTNFISTIQNFASNTAPPNPFQGMNWFDTSTDEFKMFDGSLWVVLSSTVPGANTTFRWEQPVASASWVITHNLNLVPPYVCLIQFFVDIGSGVYKPILPQDITFDSANQLTVTFSTPYAGVALLRP